MQNHLEIIRKLYTETTTTDIILLVFMLVVGVVVGVGIIRSIKNARREHKLMMELIRECDAIVLKWVR